MAPSLYRCENRGVNRWNQLCGHEQSQAWKPVSPWDQITSLLLREGSPQEGLYAAIVFQRQGWFSHVPGKVCGMPYFLDLEEFWEENKAASGQGLSDGKLVIRSWWLKAHTLQSESESWLCPLLVVRLWVDHFILYLTHKIYFKGLEWGLNELMYVLRIVPGRLALYMCKYYYYEKF